MLNNQVSVKTLRRVREAAHLLNVLTLAGGLICIQTDKDLDTSGKSFETEPQIVGQSC